VKPASKDLKTNLMKTFKAAEIMNKSEWPKFSGSLTTGAEGCLQLPWNYEYFRIYICRGLLNMRYRPIQLFV
jgi:hypothetical protein